MIFITFSSKDPIDIPIHLILSHKEFLIEFPTFLLENPFGETTLDKVREDYITYSLGIFQKAFLLLRVLLIFQDSSLVCGITIFDTIYNHFESNDKVIK